MALGCPVCAAPLAARNLREVVGDEVLLRVTLRHFPVLACAASHRFLVAPEFAAWLVDLLREGELAKIPAGAEKGLVFHKYACSGCGAELPAAAGEPTTWSATLEWKEVFPFVVDITVPILSCPSCGFEQARSRAELVKLLPVALVHAYKEAGISVPSQQAAK